MLTRHVLRSRSVTFNEDWLIHRDHPSPRPPPTSPPISGEDFSNDEIDGNRLTPSHTVTTNDDIHTPREGQPLVSGERTHSPH